MSKTVSMLTVLILAALLAIPAIAQNEDNSWGQKLIMNVKPCGELLATYTPFTEMEYDEVVTYPGGPDRDRGFALRKASFGACGQVFFDWLQVKVTASAEQETDGTFDFGLEYALMRAGWIPENLKESIFEPSFGFTVGAMKVPFSRQYLTSEPKLQFINRAMVIDEIQIQRDIGATGDFQFNVAEGIAVISISGGAFNGSGNKVYAADNNDDLMYAARMRVDLLSPMADGEGDARATFLSGEGLSTQLSINGPQLSLGGSFKQNNDIDRTVTAYGADAEFRWMGISVSGEYIKAKYELDLDETTTGDAFADEWETEGWYIQGGFFVWPRHLELAGRYETYRIDLLNDLSDDRVLAITTMGLNFHVASKHHLKLSANYMLRAELEGMPELDNDSAVIQAGLHF